MLLEAGPSEVADWGAEARGGFWCRLDMSWRREVVWWCLVQLGFAGKVVEDLRQGQDPGDREQIYVVCA